MTKAKAKKNKRKATFIGLVIDRSGSMGSIREQAIAAINEQLRTIRDGSKDIGEVYITLVQFDDQIQIDFANKDVKSILNEEYTINNYIPRGSTALRDAMYHTIVQLEEASNKADTDDVACLVVVISDGEENASKEISAPALASKIKELQDGGKWTFSYMLSNVDLSMIEQTFHAYAGNVSSFTSNAVGTLAASNNLRCASINYLTGRGDSVGSYSSAGFYTAPITNGNGTITVNTTNITTDNSGEIK